VLCIVWIPAPKARKRLRRDDTRGIWLDSFFSSVIIGGMNTKILIVDDEKDLCELVSMNLENEGFIVSTASSGQEAVSMMVADRPDLVLMDVMLGDMSGINLTAKIKNNPETADIPVIMLTAKDSENDVVVGLSVGADDYVTKPFSTRILAARIEAVLKRAAAADISKKKTLAIGPLKIVVGSRKVLVAGRSVNLTGGEFCILVALVRAGGGVVSRAELLEAAGTGSDYKKGRIIDVHIAAIRKKLDGHKSIIKTVHGGGYRIDT
jgi:two-component system phosphate regulon response regulator PhoB